MVRRSSIFLWVFSVTALAAVSCSIDARKLEITDGTAGTGGTAGTAGDDTMTSGGSTTIAGTTGSSGTGGRSGTAGSAGSGMGGAGGGSAGTGGGLLGAGEQCAANGDCKSGACLDNVCCGTACSGKCASCALAITGKPDGTCASVPANTDPHDDCAKGTDVCGLDGQCDGAGACHFAAPSTACGTEMCAANLYTAAPQCDGSGKCITPMGLSCEGHPCTGTRCDIKCTAPTDCPTGLYCDGTVCAPQKTNGTKCAANAECTSTHCAEGVCCGDACTAKCNSCLQANTGKTDGLCAAVKAGLAHGTDCPGSATCPAGAATYTPGPACDGAGACKGGTGVSCGNYLCNPATTSCSTTCTSNSQCGGSYYCASGACKPKLAPGQLCGSSAQCTSGTCSGRCCPVGKACTCPQPSAGNLLKNPGFETDLSGWTADPGSTTINWQPGTFVDGNGSYADANECPYSGSGYISFTGSGFSQDIWQCVPISPSTDYTFGVQMHTLSGAYAGCDVSIFQGPGCTGTENVGIAGQTWLNVAWSPVLTATFNSSFYASARVACRVEDTGAFFVDDISLGVSPGGF